MVEQGIRAISGVGAGKAGEAVLAVVFEAVVGGDTFRAEGYAGMSLAELAELGPAIVAVNLDGYPHFVVFRARSGDRVLIADPAFGNRSVEVEVFEKAWQKVAFAVERPGGGKPPSRLGPRLQDELRPSTDMIRSALR